MFAAEVLIYNLQIKITYVLASEALYALLSPRPTKLDRGDVGFNMSVFLCVCVCVCLSVNSLQARVF